jgi:hypothetical protein
VRRKNGPLGSGKSQDPGRLYCRGPSELPARGADGRRCSSWNAYCRIKRRSNSSSEPNVKATAAGERPWLTESYGWLAKGMRALLRRLEPPRHRRYSIPMPCAACLNIVNSSTLTYRRSSLSLHSTISRATGRRNRAIKTGSFHEEWQQRLTLYCRQAEVERVSP